MSATLLAGCGGATSASPCPRAARAALAKAAGTSRVRERVVERGPGLVTCEERAGGTAVRVRVDTLPQAYRRWSNAQDETTQNTAGWRQIPSQQPIPVEGVGLGAYWVSGPRELVGTNGVRLVTVQVLRSGGRAPLALATSVGRAALPRVPGVHV